MSKFWGLLPISVGFLLFIRADFEKFSLGKNTKYSIIKNENNFSNHGIGVVWNEDFLCKIKRCKNNRTRFLKMNVVSLWRVILKKSIDNLV